jgi:hypothetical protein
MPTVLRIGPYRFFFYSNENSEPPHIHVKAADCESKFWLEPVQLVANHGFRVRDLSEIESLVIQNCGMLMEAWNEYFT